MTMTFVVGCTPMSSSMPAVSPQPSLEDHQQVTVEVGDKKLRVEVVTHPDSITQGLSERSEIGSDGMLFLLPTQRQAHFWMKQMKFDLDLIWIKDGQVVGITANVPHPSATTPDHQLPNYPSPGEVAAVLEVPAGQAQQLGIVVGDTVTLMVP